MASKYYLLQSSLWSGLPRDLTFSHRPRQRNNLHSHDRFQALDRLSACVSFQNDRDLSLCRNWNRNSPASADLELRCAAAAADVKGPSKHDLVDGLSNSGIHDHKVGKDLPPLMPSLAIAELPEPVLAIAYETETEKYLMEVANRWQLDSIKPWIRPSISFCSFVFGQTISQERFDAICFVNLWTFVLDDNLLERRNDANLDQLGIDRGVVESPATILAYFHHLQAIFQSVQALDLPNPPSPIEVIIWESGQQLRRLSTSCPDWFTIFSDTLLEFFESAVTSESEIKAGNYESLLDLETYTRMRMGNTGANFVVPLLELGSNVYLHRNVRAHPTFEQLVDAAKAQMVLVQDIFSYSKEIIEEPDNPRNIIRVLTDFQGLSLPQAAWRTVDMINAHAATFMELVAQVDQQHFRDSEPEVGLIGASDVRTWAADLKLMVSGNLLWHSLAKRYRHPLAVFPELRDREHGTVD